MRAREAATGRRRRAPAGCSRRSRSSAGSRASSPAACRAGCVTPARTRSATASQTLAYLCFVTDRYPNADPTALLAQLEPPPRHPVRLVGDSDDLRRSRLTVLLPPPARDPALRLAPALVGRSRSSPSIAQWFVTLVRGVPAAPLHRFLARYVRYGFHVGAFFFLAANPFPGFGGAPGHYPLDLELPQPGPPEPLEDRLPAASSRSRPSSSSAALGVALVIAADPDLVRRRSPRARRPKDCATSPPTRSATAAQTNAYVFLRHRRLSAREPARGRRRRAGLPSRRRRSSRLRESADRARLAALVALAALWSVARLAALAVERARRRCTCRTSSAGDYFSAAELHRAASFARVGRADLGRRRRSSSSSSSSLYARRGGRFARESAAGPIGTGMLLGMLGFALLWLAELPFDVLGLWWARRHGLVHGGYVDDAARRLARARRTSSSSSASRSRS